VNVPNFVAIGQAIAEIWRFLISQNGGRRHLGFLKFRKGQEGQTASPCQISWRSVKPLPRYGDFSIFQNGGRRHLGFKKIKILTVGKVKIIKLR